MYSKSVECDFLNSYTEDIQINKEIQLNLNEDNGNVEKIHS